ncbi:hypothetical protein [Streptomyces sp. NBC_00344]|uniref:hypothetical protein n=1 Tax=Streptomyces sp. NBC_00344 TaxID=2975720 RepID=UPI002E2476FF
MRSATGVRALRVAAGAASAAGLVGALTAVPAAGAGRAAAGPDLVIAEHAPVSGVRPGSSTGMSFAVKNRGDAPATRVVLYLNGSQGLAFAERYTNCAYEDTPAQDEGPAQVNAVCAVGQTLEPGAVYAPEKPVGLHILDRALYERFGVNAQADSPSFPGGTGRAAGTGPVLRLVEQQPPADPGAVHGDYGLSVPITADSSADFALTGARLRGKRGATVTAGVTFANRGPAWVANDVSSPIGVFDVRLPPGTRVTGAPDFCRPAGAGGAKGRSATGSGSVYRCTTPYDYADAHSERAYPFRLRIDRVVRNATGTVAFVRGDHRWGTLPFDRNPADNTAEIVVNASDTGGGPVTPHASAPPGSASAGSASAGSASVSGGAGGDELADTGAGDSLFAGGAAAGALLAGGALLLTSRERMRSSVRRRPVRGTSR